MYVCLCKGVTEREIREEVRSGACHMRELQRRLGVAECCGCCAPCAREILAETLQEQHRKTRLLPAPFLPATANAS
ncbi:MULTISPECIES: bacterioferritin-associated ferredoxin [Spectribacter]|uniref:Bacterioferritin-associated ferredoxin n=2 Tax=Spectribacter TaxID=3160928 RepID=A0ABU3BYN5_9GAMM|nr:MULTISPECIES: bacterioferritin-associated ferredoxin [unclassified Salinisphaera]MDT0619772.1 bacterioferritin-associated ferredoxin [Salinisphaera sp. P385]MDT0634433.1 bacterioferritin-associated ferredoxin [Salinisphaera sp. W335]